MLVLKIYYNYNTDTTKVKVNEELSDLPLIHQLDALQDAIGLVSEVYEKKLKELSEGKYE